MKLEEIRKITGTITLETGLHIGGGDMEMHIGGTDKTVAKHPVTQEPYIPGSSLKGKTRSLLEMASGLMGITYGKVVSGDTLKKVQNDPEQKRICGGILKVFGSSGADLEDDTQLGPTRVSFSDCFLDPKWVEKARENRVPLTEVKAENSIHRIKGTAENPRFIERVPQGAKFKFEISFKVMDVDDPALFSQFLLTGLKLLEWDALGGNGSRGYGKVSLKLDDETLQEQFDNLKPFSH